MFDLSGSELPIIQAPMAGVQASALALQDLSGCTAIPAAGLTRRLAGSC